MRKHSKKIITGVVSGISVGVVVVLWYFYQQPSISTPTTPSEVIKDQAPPVQAQLQKPTFTYIPNPDGSDAWPEVSSPLNMVERANQGTGRVVVHNYSGNPLYIKICAADGKQCYGDRHVYVTPRSTFMIPRLDKGYYQIRVRTVRNPHYAAASDVFNIEEQSTRVVPIGNVPLKNMPNAVLLKALDVDQF